MKKRIADMEPGVDVFIADYKRWTPTFGEGENDHAEKTWCCTVGYSSNIRWLFWSIGTYEVIGRIGPDGKFEEVEG